MGRFLPIAALVLFSTVLVVACGTTPTGQTTPTPTPITTPAGGATTPSPSPSASPSPTPGQTAAPGTVYRCDTPDLRLTLGRALGAGGQSSRDYLFTNTSGQACGLVGFPGLLMLDQSGAPLATTVVRVGAKKPTVILQPGGTASFEAIWQNGYGYATPPPSCEFATQMEVTPPNASTQLVIGLSRLEVCANGQIEVTSVVGGTDPEGS